MNKQVDLVEDALPAPLQNAIAGEDVPIYGSGGHGVDFRNQWELPRVSKALQVLAKRELPKAEERCNPPSRDLARKWLSSLGTLTAGRMPAEEARSKLIAYSEFFDHPSGAFTKETLRLAAKEFKWFPSFSELSTFLDEQSVPIRNERDRIKAIADATIEEPQKPKNIDPEERERRTNETMAEYRKNMAEDGGPKQKRYSPDISERHSKWRQEFTKQYTAQNQAGG